MGRVTYEPCPSCRARGQDTRGDNLVRFPDGGATCFACGHKDGTSVSHYWKRVGEQNGRPSESKEGALPRDFTREIPAAGWKWLLQWGLPYTYWRPHCGYSETFSRLVFPIGNPVKFSVGRLLPRPDQGNDGGESSRRNERSGHSDGENVRLPWVRNKENVLVPERKWYVWGDRRGTVPILGEAQGDYSEVVLVEDIISAHKVAQVCQAIPLFGANIGDEVVKVLQALKRPVRLWLDNDQYPLLPKKLNRLQGLLEAPVGYVRTDLDPKKYSVQEIKEFLK